MGRFFYAQEIGKAEDVIPYLAKQERHWRKAFSAYDLAHSWVNTGDIPASVRSVLDTCPDYAEAHLVEGLFERDVDLRTPGRRSQADLLALHVSRSPSRRLSSASAPSQGLRGRD